MSNGVRGRGFDIKNVPHAVNYDLPAPDYRSKDEYIFVRGENVELAIRTSQRPSTMSRMSIWPRSLPGRHSWNLLDFLEGYKPADVAAHDLDDDIRDEENEPIQDAASADDLRVLHSTLRPSAFAVTGLS
ncbi:hypothetical protein LTR70_006359 [Exophiala xenobiotica]|uniref:Uncharacterized protein n=1 Tax=Lithohypha guttulata TaxID=1690604 RepID=A0ABR0K7W8_9EURO|nr:hypothetical protein LTR24_005828 [Lithohypha guttulata]KAK5316304.1 hypothetical protein LTR70_006359 [Exophiala xenobiotica]